MRRRRGEPVGFGGATGRSSNSPNVAAAKSALRREMRRRRESITAAQQERESAAMVRAVLEHPIVDEAEIVHSFIGALPGEIITRDLVRKLLARGKQIVCPRLVTGQEDLEHRRIRSLDELVESDLGLWEPGAECEPVDLAVLEVILVPGLAFDREGGRLGMGRGYYDRLIARCDATPVGLCYSLQVVDAVPLGVGDACMDWIVADETIDCRRKADG